MKPTQAQIEAAQKFDGSDIRWRDELIRELRTEIKRLAAAAEAGEQTGMDYGPGTPIGGLKDKPSEIIIPSELSGDELFNHNGKYVPIQMIAATIERSARVADDFGDKAYTEPERRIATAIAAAIRK